MAIDDVKQKELEERRREERWREEVERQRKIGSGATGSTGTAGTTGGAGCCLFTVSNCLMSSLSEL